MHDAVSSSVFPFPHSQVLIKTFHDAVATLEIVPSAASIYIFAACLPHQTNAGLHDK